MLQDWTAEWTGKVKPIKLVLILMLHACCLLWCLLLLLAAAW
jgi:hypothetical protein